MSSYTIYHKSYHETHRENINLKKKKKYAYKNYGIPVEMYAALCDEFHAHKKFYVKLKTLDPILVRLMMKKFHPNEDRLSASRFLPIGHDPKCDVL